MKTAELVSKIATRVSSGVSESEIHISRLLPNLGIKYVGIPDGVHQNLIDNNLVWIVDEKFISKFKYAAGLKGGVYFEPAEHKEYPNRYPRCRVDYIGDIPDFALDNLAIARKCGFGFFTVHSTHPLPTRNIFEKVDPVLVGWLENPEITTVEGFWRDRRYVKVGVLGIIVAIWDRDKESKVL